MFMNIIVGIMAVIACAAGIWGFAVDHKKEKDAPDETPISSDSTSQTKVTK